MNVELVNEALVTAYDLLCHEIETVCDDSLQIEYEQAIKALEMAISELKSS